LGRRPGPGLKPIAHQGSQGLFKHAAAALPGWKGTSKRQPVREIEASEPQRIALLRGTRGSHRGPWTGPSAKAWHTANRATRSLPNSAFPPSISMRLDPMTFDVEVFDSVPWSESSEKTGTSRFPLQPCSETCRPPPVPKPLGGGESGWRWTGLWAQGGAAGPGPPRIRRLPVPLPLPFPEIACSLLEAPARSPSQNPPTRPLLRWDRLELPPRRLL